MLRTRAISALVLVPPLLIALALGTAALTVVLVIVAALGASEAFRLLKGAGFSSLPVFGTALAVAFVLEAYWRPFGDTGLLLVAIGTVLAGIGAFARLDPRDGLLAWVGTVFGAVYVGLISNVLHVAATAPAVPAAAPLSWLGGERGWVLLLVLGVWSFDTGAYLVGRQVGRHKFLTHISPSKSIEGVIGGIVATTAVIALLLAGLGQQPLGALVLGPLLGIAAQAGDLAESMLKRAAGAKDSGTLIPGHGGMLDRIDSFLFAGPVVALYVLVLTG
ncbi:MAG TPA: phosphatidate cytidylyltransferase [Candidatus Limnocylindrales bacterium]|nr:phosphatidate cytidylyltransferase [Candidatus Limnocylindrales bacterium]